MGGWIGVAIGVAGAALLFKLGHPVLGGIAVFFAVLQFWSFGIMHNYSRDPTPPPIIDTWSAVNVVAWFASAALLIAAGIFWVR